MGTHRILSPTILLAASVLAIGSARADQPARVAMPRVAMISAVDTTATQAVHQDENAARWYSAADVELGREIFAANCSVCHGARGEGGIVGSLTAPPLNGKGHSAHHGLDYLLEQISNGGAPKGGRMPAFGTVLTADQRRAAVAWIQNLWPDAVYSSWQRLQQGGHQH